MVKLTNDEHLRVESLGFLNYYETKKVFK